MSRNSLINSITRRGGGSGSSSVRETFEHDRYLAALLVEAPNNEDDFATLGWWKQFNAPMLLVVGRMTRDLLIVQVQPLLTQVSSAKLLMTTTITWMLR